MLDFDFHLLRSVRCVQDSPRTDFMTASGNVMLFMLTLQYFVLSCEGRPTTGWMHQTGIDPAFLVSPPSNRVMKAGAEMPAVEGRTIGMTPDNCMAYCYNHPKQYKFFGEYLCRQPAAKGLQSRAGAA